MRWSIGISLVLIISLIWGYISSLIYVIVAVRWSGITVVSCIVLVTGVITIPLVLIAIPISVLGSWAPVRRWTTESIIPKSITIPITAPAIVLPVLVVRLISTLPYITVGVVGSRTEEVWDSHKKQVQDSHIAAEQGFWDLEGVV